MGVAKYITIGLLFLAGNVSAESYCHARQTLINNAFMQTNCTTALLSCVISTGGRAVEVFATVRMSTNGVQQQYNFNITRDGAVIYTTNDGAMLPNLNNFLALGSMSWVVIPAAGAHTYRLNVCLPNGGQAIEGPASLIVREFPN